MPSSIPNRRFDQFNLSHLFLIVTGIGMLLAVVRIAMLLGLFSRWGLFLLGNLTILASMIYLLADHELRIQMGTRKQWGGASIILFFVLGGLSGLFLWLLTMGLVSSF